MSHAVIETPTDPIQCAILRRSRIRLISVFLLAFLVLLSIVSHLLSPTNTRIYAGKKATVIEILSADTIRIRTDTGLTEEARLLGIAPLPEPWASEGVVYLKDRLKDKVVIIQFDGTQTRTEDGKLLALIYPSDDECINVSMSTLR